MRITWVTRSFLDYRIPVYEALDKLCGHKLTVIYNGEVVPQRCQDKLSRVLGERAIPLSGEIRLTGVAKDNATMANRGFRIPLQKGLIRAIRESEPEVLLSDGFFQWTYAPLWVRAFNSKHIKHIMCYERTHHTERNAGKLRTLYRKFVSRWIDAIDCNGSQTANYVTDALNYNKPLAFGHMTAETEGVAKRTNMATQQQVDEIKTSYNLQGIVFLYIGQLIPRKGIMELLKAWLYADMKNATLLLVGDGEQKDEIHDFINLHHLTNVVVAGSVNYDDLGPYYRAADCFIIPTLEDNWSLVVPEAMSAGLPVACSIYNGCHPELVHHENGWTFDPLDSQSVIKTLKTVSSKKEYLKEMGNESKRIVSKHTPAHAAEELYSLCEAIVKKR